MLAKFKNERKEKDAHERMELELYIEYMEGLGLESAARMRQGLEEFARMDEFEGLKK